MTEDSTMNKIVRSPDRAEGGLTADERRKMEQHTAMWIARAMRTDPIEPDKIIPAIHALYAAADLPTPRVVIVPSPIVGAFAYGAAAAIWCARKTGEANSSSREATGEATYAATGEATRVATDAATACRELAGEMGIACAAQWRRSYQGGNMWSSYDCYLTAARDILGLDLPEHEKYAAWEQCAIHGGFRFVHSEFCIVSDFPAVLRVDEQNRPHCETGPSHLWRDGTALYYWHGVKIPGEWIEDRASLTPQIALSQTNADARAAAIQIIGWQRMTDALGAKVVDRHPEGMAGGELLAVEKSKVVAGERGTMKLLRAECPRNGTICFRVPDSIQTAHEAQAWSRGLPPEIFRLPSTRT